MLSTVMDKFGGLPKLTSPKVLELNLPQYYNVQQLTYSNYMMTYEEHLLEVVG